MSASRLGGLDGDMHMIAGGVGRDVGNRDRAIAIEQARTASFADAEEMKRAAFVVGVVTGVLSVGVEPGEIDDEDGACGAIAERRDEGEAR